jgi:uncharacterized protein
MKRRTWNESGRVWSDDYGLLDETQVEQCARADAAGLPRSPIPTRMISNGEYLPIPQTRQQRQVEARLAALSDDASARLRIDRRRFLAGSGGMAASLIAMNEVFGRFFNVSPVEMLVPAAYAQSGTPADVFVFDDQLHLVRGSAGNAGAALRALAQGPSSPGFAANPFNAEGHEDERGDTWGVWNPELVGLPNDESNAQLVQFIKDVYLDSQITIGLLSNVTASVISSDGEVSRPPRNAREAAEGEILTAAQTAAARDFINEISGSTRMLAHGLLYVGRGNLGFLEEQIEQNGPDSWKGYNISNAAKVDDDPESLMRPWRHDDEEVAYPTFELIERYYRELRETKPGFNNVCVHKGLAPGPADPERGHPADLPKAARDWPNLNFITYHACIQPAFFMHAALEEIRSGRLRNGVPNISWTTEYAELVAEYPNCYAEIGTTWASSIVTFPTVAAHIMGQLMKYLGPDRIVFGSDSVWYGSPQWQIDAFWRFQIPEEMRDRYGYPEITEQDKRKILGLNSARLYGITAAAVDAATYRSVPADFEERIPEDLKTLLEFPGYTADNMARFRESYVAYGASPEHVRYGWVRRG